MQKLAFILIIFSSSVLPQNTIDDQPPGSSNIDKMVIIVIDGARYSETFGDPNHSYISNMWALSQQGTIIDNFHNDFLTFTSRAIPALWCGRWTAVKDTFYEGSQTKYSVSPSIFEYYRKQKNMPPNECIYVINFIPNLWLQSFDPDYGPAYWPHYHSVGQSDADVAYQAQLVMDTDHPHFLWIYLSDVDHGGHSGNWNTYTQAITTADSIVAVIWDKIQSDPFYQNKTSLFVTNDHGRHDDQNGGFQGHGDGCEGCRHIQFLALGPNIRQNYISTQYRRIPDMAVTVAEILGVAPTQATGNNMPELFSATAVEPPDHSVRGFSLQQNFPNPFNPATMIKFSITKSEYIELKIFSVSGNEILTLVQEQLSAGSYSYAFTARHLSSGVFFYRLGAKSFSETKKMIVLR